VASRVESGFEDSKLELESSLVSTLESSPSPSPSPSPCPWLQAESELNPDSKGIVHSNGNICRDRMRVVFLTWEVTLYVILTVSARMRMNTLLQIANKDSSVLPMGHTATGPQKSTKAQ
jgi:hypothetical protein